MPTTLTFEEMKRIEPALDAIEREVLSENERALTDEVYWGDVWHEIKGAVIQSVGFFCNHPEMNDNVSYQTAIGHLEGLATNMK